MANELGVEFPIILHFTIANVADPGPTDGILAGGNGVGGPMVPTGYVFRPVSIGVETNDDWTAGAATIAVTADGTELANGPEAVLDTTNNTRHESEKERLSDTVDEDEEIGVSATAPSWTPITADGNVVAA